MVVTPFGDLHLGDAVGLQRRIDNHDRRHRAEVQRLQGPTGGTLLGPIDADWFLRHGSRHVSLATYQRLQLGSSTAALYLPRLWQTEEQLQVWHQLHNRIHQLQDRQLGLN